LALVLTTVSNSANSREDCLYKKKVKLIKGAFVMNAKDVKEAARRFGADLVGISPVERLAELPADKNPLSIFPECKSVIVLGRRILRGSLRGVEEGTNFGSTYATFGYRYLEDNFLSRTTYDLTCWLEAENFEAVPLFAYNQEGMPKGTPVKDGKPAPNVIIDFEAAAQAAGIAEIGLGGFLITPEFGTRQRISVILTDVELEADDIREKSICSDCGACLQVCPLGAYNPDKKVKAGLPGHECEVAELDYSLCDVCPNGAVLAGGRGVKPDRIASACGRACLVQLEESGKCGNKFQHPFRKRKPWRLDALSRPVDTAKVGVGCDGEAKR
jgi:ferredoxin